MFTIKLIHLSLVAATMFSSCGNTSKLSYNQGIEGKVVLRSGNQMPSPDVVQPKPKGIKTTLYVYALTNISQVKQQKGSSFFSSVATTLIDSTVSATNGTFSIKLPPGKYSLFVKKDTLLYANWFDEKNNIAPVEVVGGKMSTVDFFVDYNAVY